MYPDPYKKEELDRELKRVKRELETVELRLKHAHQARRAKVAQLDEIKRAMIDTGVITEDDPYSHADLADVIRQTPTGSIEKYDRERLELNLVAARSERDQGYTERAQLLALLAAVTPDTVLTLAEDIDEFGWHLLYLPMGGFIHTWHISPGDLRFFNHVPVVPQDDPRAQWDGHTTEDKYNRIQHHIFQITRG